jgi:hypothetical protein
VSFRSACPGGKAWRMPDDRFASQLTLVQPGSAQPWAAATLLSSLASPSASDFQRAHS